MKKLAEGAAWRWGEPRDEATRGNRMVPAGNHHGKGGGVGEEDQPHPPLLCVRWGGETFDHLAKRA